MQVKTPAESTGPWDYYKIIATIPGDQAFRSAGEDGCLLINRRQRLVAKVGFDNLSSEGSHAPEIAKVREWPIILKTSQVSGQKKSVKVPIGCGL